MATLVRFVKDKEGYFKGDITAVFPQLKYNKVRYGNGMCTGYAHIGQHTAVSLDYIKECTQPAAPEEYSDLKRELEQIGYVLKVCK